MKKAILTTVLLFIFTLASMFACGCQFLAGAAVGTAGTGAAYEYNAKQQLDRLEEDYKAGKITKEEYEARKKQIDEGSIIY